MGSFTSEVIIDEKLGTQIIKLSKINVDRDEELTVKIAPEFGSNIFSLKYKGTEFIDCNLETLINRGFTGNYILFPFPNRIKNKEFFFENTHYSFKNIDRLGIENLIHGFVFDKKWKYEEPKIFNEFASCTTFIEFNKHYQEYKNFPFEFRLELTTKLSENSVTINYTVKNLTDKKSPFGFGLHPFFKTIPDKINVNLTVPAKYMMENDNDLLPTGRLIPITETKNDISSPREISKLNLDTVFTSIDRNEETILDYEKLNTKIKFRTSEEFNHVVVFTGNPDDQFVCVENQTCSTDAVNLFNKGFEKESGLLILNPQETHYGFIEYTFVDYS